MNSEKFGKKYISGTQNYKRCCVQITLLLWLFSFVKNVEYFTLYVYDTWLLWLVVGSLLPVITDYASTTAMHSNYSLVCGKLLKFSSFQDDIFALIKNILR